MDVFLNGKRVRLDPATSIGKGGEADVFDLGDGRALKVFKAPEHPDYAGLPAEQRAAQERIALHQQKLCRFPGGLPAQVIAPGELATDKQRARIVGYAMPLLRGAEVLLRFAEPSLRATAGCGLTAAEVCAILLSLHRTVEAVHRCGVVIGDFNDLNVLVQGGEAFLIDADSFQFGPYLCRVFTERFVDPRLCDATLERPVLSSPFSPDSDWYAFAVMVMQSLLCVGPYGGVLSPRPGATRVPQSARPLRRITVFHRDVRYPKPAIPVAVLPDELLHELHMIFEQDRRGTFPRALIEALVWQRCAACGVEHARRTCPLCAAAPPAEARVSASGRGEVIATCLLSTRGVVLAASLDAGELRVLLHEDGRFLREDGAVVMTGAPDRAMRFAVHGKATLIGRGGELVVLSPDAAPARVFVDCLGQQPLFDANERFLYWIRGGQLRRGGGRPPRGGGLAAAVEEGAPIGDVLAGQTVFWVGERFGLGFSRAGNVSISFVFDAQHPGIKDTIKLPLPGGRLLDATCVFNAGQPGLDVAQGRAWLFLAAEQGGRTVHRCVVVREDGAVLAMADAEAGDGSWLGALTGKCAAGGFLLSATDAGLVRVEVRAGALVEARRFPGTEPLVNQASRLLIGPGGLVVVDARSVSLLRIS